MKNRSQSPMGLYTIGIAALFLAGFFLLVFFGAQNYRNTVAGQNDNMKNRALLSYLSTVGKSYNEAGALKVEDSPYGQMLVVKDGDSGYAIRIYCLKGELLEDYAPVQAELSPEEAHVIGLTEEFRLERKNDRLLAVYTDAGRVLLHNSQEITWSVPAETQDEEESAG